MMSEAPKESPKSHTLYTAGRPCGRHVPCRTYLPSYNVMNATNSLQSLHEA